MIPLDELQTFVETLYCSKNACLEKHKSCFFMMVEEEEVCNLSLTNKHRVRCGRFRRAEMWESYVTSESSDKTDSHPLTCRPRSQRLTDESCSISKQRQTSYHLVSIPAHPVHGQRGPEHLPATTGWEASFNLGRSTVYHKTQSHHRGAILDHIYLFIYLFISVIILLYTSYLNCTAVSFNPVSGSRWPACMSPEFHYPYCHTTRKRFSVFQYEVCGMRYVDALIHVVIFCSVQANMPFWLTVCTVKDTHIHDIPHSVSRKCKRCRQCTNIWRLIWQNDGNSIDRWRIFKCEYYVLCTLWTLIPC